MRRWSANTLILLINTSALLWFHIFLQLLIRPPSPRIWSSWKNGQHLLFPLFIFQAMPFWFLSWSLHGNGFHKGHLVTSLSFCPWHIFIFNPCLVDLAAFGTVNHSFRLDPFSFPGSCCTVFSQFPSWSVATVSHPTSQTPPPPLHHWASRLPSADPTQFSSLQSLILPPLQSPAACQCPSYLYL